MPKRTTATAKATNRHLQALWTLSDTSGAFNAESLTQQIYEAPDPETAVREVLKHVPSCSDVLQRKWRKLVVSIWSQHHPHLPVLLDVPIAATDVNEVAAVQDALAFLRNLIRRPAGMVFEEKEWLLSSPEAYHLASQLPSQNNKPLVQLENEWQYLSLRRVRAVLQALRLVRRVNDQLVIVKSRYSRFEKLPSIQQYYLLWHAEAYHIDWSQFAGMWGDYLRVVQEYLPLLWNISDGALPDMPHDVRQWNHEVWDTYSPLWEQEGLLAKQHNQSALLSLVRIHSLPTAVTQVVLKDLLERYGIVYGEGDLVAYSHLGIELLEAERTRDLPCALDLIK